MAKLQPRLGKGLTALIRPPATDVPHTVATTATNPGIPDTSQAADHNAARPPAADILYLPIDHILPNAHQSRKAFDPDSLQRLADSIRNAGVLQPVLVRHAAQDRFELLAGERRWRAAQIAGLSTVPAIVHPVGDAEAMEIALIENLQREDLNPIERALAYRQYLEFYNAAPETLAQRVGESRANVANYLRLLHLAAPIQAMIAAGELGMGQARALAAIEDEKRQIALAKLVVRRNLAVRQVENLVRSAASACAPRPSPTSPGHDRHLADVQQTLAAALGLRVRLFPGKKKNSGRVVIYYDHLDDFDRIADRLSGKTAIE